MKSKFKFHKKGMSNPVVLVVFIILMIAVVLPVTINVVAAVLPNVTATTGLILGLLGTGVAIATLVKIFQSIQNK